MQHPLSAPSEYSHVTVRRSPRGVLIAGLIAAVTWIVSPGHRLSAQDGPSVVDPNLIVRTVVSGLESPVSMAFLGPSDLLVAEKNTGRVRRIVNGAIQDTVLDLAVNFGSERGLLSIVLDPQFRTTSFVYLYWTESTTGADTDVLSATSLLGNRVDRFLWDGASLILDRNLIRLRALQEDQTNPGPRGNHNGGVLRFGLDGKLYIFMGDNGRRGQMQNLPDGPGCTALPCPAIPQGDLPDDQFGGPEPDDAHLTGVILRLNSDGTTPADNPFFRAGALRGGEVGANLQKVFAYGIRNGFGMAVDPFTGNLWDAQNGDDSFTEINLVDPGSNLGWVQVMGPLRRLAQFKEIETSVEFDGLQQVRWPPANIADSAAEAFARLFMVFEDGDTFVAGLEGGQELPPVTTTAGAIASFRLNANGTLSFRLQATRRIENATAAHIHLGARGQNGTIVAFLLPSNPGTDFAAGQVIAAGTLDDADISSTPRFGGTVAALVERMRQGRAYANLHTAAHPAGEIRGAIVVNGVPVSRYSDPEFSWKFEVSPAAVGFMSSGALGLQYVGDMFTGAARPTLEGGQLFHFNLTRNRRAIAVSDPLLQDRVADNVAKFDMTESETLLFGRNFGVGTDIQTGRNGNLFVTSLSNGAIYEIARRP
jgi:glucose/arabinose dehydrogenase